MMVTIYDVDFVADHHKVNYLAMKVSSYYKQLGHQVHLAKTVKELRDRHDRVIMFKQDQSLDNPPLEYLMRDKTDIYGIPYFTNWEPNEVMLACRPDYLLYPDSREYWASAAVYQFTDNHGHLLRKTQNADTVLNKERPCVILDKNLWVLPQKDLLLVLQKLRKLENLYFFEPISMRAIISDQLIKESFLQLKFNPKNKITWNNSLPCNADNIKRVADFLNELHTLHQANDEATFEWRTYTHQGKQPTVDIMNCMLIMELNKKYGLSMICSPMENRLQSIYADYYNLMSVWSTKYPKLCYYEMLAALCGSHNSVEFYAHPEWWYGAWFKTGIEWAYTFLAHGGHREQLLHQWGAEYYPAQNIRWDAFPKDRALWL